MTVTADEIVKKFDQLISFAAGDLEAKAHSPCSSQAPQEGCVAYIPKAEEISQCVKSGVKILIIPEKLNQKVELKGQALLTTKDLNTAMAFVNNHFFPKNESLESFGSGQHPSAVVSKTAKVGQNTTIGPGASIGNDVIIGDNCFIGANTTVEALTEIGDNTHIYPQNYIGHSTIIGSGCVIHPQSTIASDGYGFATDKNNDHHRKPHYGRVVLGNNVEIGANVSVDRGAYGDTSIGEGTKIDNHCHFAHNTKIGKNCLITAGFIIAGSSSIGDNCIFGGRVSVNGHINITSNCLFTAMTVITGHVTKPGQYGGYPMQSYKDSLKSIASVAKLPKLRQEFKELKNKLNL